MTLLDVDGNTVNVIMTNMSYGIYEEVRKNKDDSFSIFLNSRYNDETLRDALEHAIKHIRNNDWDKLDVQVIETEAHGLTCVEKIDNGFADIINRLRKERQLIGKKLEKYRKKYANMDTIEIMRHNDFVIEQYEKQKGF